MLVIPDNMNEKYPLLVMNNHQYIAITGTIATKRHTYGAENKNAKSRYSNNGHLGPRERNFNTWI
jgi:hypothetical protein